MEAPAQEEQQTKVAARAWYGASVAEFLRLLSGLGYYDFRGDRWTNIHNTENRRYLRNAYRVLLTRARQGMVIFVPPGDRNDPTRAPEYYDATYKYLAGIGVPELICALRFKRGWHHMIADWQKMTPTPIFRVCQIGTLMPTLAKCLS